MLRRIGAIASALALASLAPVPLSACALAAHLPGDCPCAQVTSHCHKLMMSHDGGSVRLDRNWNCCRVTQAPLPEPRSRPPLPVVALPVAHAGAPALLVRPVPTWPEKIAIPSASPPDQQALYCVFLV